MLPAAPGRARGSRERPRCGPAPPGGCSRAPAAGSGRRPARLRGSADTARASFGDSRARAADAGARGDPATGAAPFFPPRLRSARGPAPPVVGVSGGAVWPGRGGSAPRASRQSPLLRIAWNFLERVGQGPRVSPVTLERVLKLCMCFIRVLYHPACFRVLHHPKSSVGMFLQNRLSGLPAWPFRIQPSKLPAWTVIRLSDGLLWVEPRQPADFAKLVQGETMWLNP